MRNNTRLLYSALLAQIAQLNGVPSAEQKFSVDPSVQQTLETRMQETSDFLARINIIGVTEQIGAKLGLGIGSPIASTTNTATTDRATKDPTALDENGYHCTQTNSDTHLPYAKLDAWAKFPDFQTRVRDAIIRRQALDRILIGFNGTSRAATSNAATNPLLQDVNKGWLQKYREQAPARVLADGASAGANQILVGSGAGTDYKNLDALVMDAVANLVDPWHRNDTQLVAVLGSDLLHDKYFPLVNAANPATEQVAADLIISAKRVGGRSAVQVPFMKANSILITRLDNLSIYWQEGGRRRAVTDNPKRDCIENWESSNDAYVVEDFGAGCLIENIVLQP
ncbi:phage major capsid protein, P2 family [Lysobacter sp. TAF61]|uniref:phage major capsid protein, P2 family n=1 Tax=Lysobacter sp. TAF61 TaxID=3233072 RepID=UPI003F96D95B